MTKNWEFISLSASRIYFKLPVLFYVLDCDCESGFDINVWSLDLLCWCLLLSCRTISILFSWETEIQDFFVCLLYFLLFWRNIGRCKKSRYIAFVTYTPTLMSHLFYIKSTFKTSWAGFIFHHQTPTNSLQRCSRLVHWNFKLAKKFSQFM